MSRSMCHWDCGWGIKTKHAHLRVRTESVNGSVTKLLNDPRRQGDAYLLRRSSSVACVVACVVGAATLR